MSNYFSQLPDFEYVSRLPDSRISDYIPVKNLFMRGKLREDIFAEASVFTKYKIVGDDRPDNVAYQVYGSTDYDWLILLANNIVNVGSEWPMTQESFSKYMTRKYGAELNFYKPHHYETVEVKDSIGRIIVRPGLQVPKDYTISYYDSGLDSQITTTNIVKEYSNYDYENEIQDNIRNIFVIKKEYIGIVLDDIERIMPYKSGSTQYRANDLVQGDNIRLYT